MQFLEFMLSIKYLSTASKVLPLSSFVCLNRYLNWTEAFVWKEYIPEGNHLFLSTVWVIIITTHIITNPMLLKSLQVSDIVVDFLKCI